MHRHDPSIAQGHLIETGEDVALTSTETTFGQALEVDLASLSKGRRALFILPGLEFA